jgi:hypothetical protein
VLPLPFYSCPQHNKLTVLEFSLTEYRCEENASTRDALYVAERQEHDQTKKALLKAQERNWELLRKVDDSEKTINKMLENAQRSLSYCHNLYS